MRRRPPVLALGAAVLAGLLGGCAALSRPPAGPDTLAGRLSVRVEAEPVRSFSSAFELGGSAELGRLTLTSPLGTVLATVQWSPQGALLTAADGGTTTAARVEDLAEQVLGERVPVAALLDWLHGRPWPLAPYTLTTQDPAGFEQLGWRVDLDRLADGRVEARRASPPPVAVRVVLDRP